MPGYRWKPITPLSDDDRAMVEIRGMRSLYETWLEASERLRASSAAHLEEFNRRLVRGLSIETGILERLYDLDRGTTEALIAGGFAEDLVSRSSTDIEPARLIDILRDQEAAIGLAMDCVSQNRPLTEGLLHQLHEVLTRHQETTTAVDQFGTRMEIPLLKGQFKKHPNNPGRPDGTIHEYCPPLQVDSEIENLLHWLDEYRDEDPILVASWLHHRFTQIHPYQDGNGRTARVLTTLVLLRARLLPLVIDRDLRTEYIQALEAADAGSLGPLSGQFARLERSAITRALSIEPDREMAYQQSLSSSVIDALAAKFDRRREQRHAGFRRVNELARALRQRAHEQIRCDFDRLAATVSTDAHIADGGSDHQTGHWYRFDVIRAARKAGSYANFSEDHYFVKAWIRVDGERLVFVVSFHHAGQELTGMMEAIAFAHLESRAEVEDRELPTRQFAPCSVEPFVFTWRTDEEDIVPLFRQWLDRSMAAAFKQFADLL